LDVLRLIRDGNRNKQIADQLAISENTVNFHIKNLVDKLQANDRTHAVTIASGAACCKSESAATSPHAAEIWLLSSRQRCALTPRMRTET